MVGIDCLLDQSFDCALAVFDCGVDYGLTGVYCRRKLYSATSDWLKKRGGPTYRVDGLYVWNAGEERGGGGCIFGG